ncbi:trypsin-like serine protease [Streptomyces sp. NPDC089919]|uniref:trypsin-like serine peptidase n=1 Tax=Streptomyces sp. NPDC089919 TaxID=3155188 RepID=UPI00343CBAD8
MDRRNVVTAVLCAVAAVGGSALVTVLAPPDDGPAGQPAAAAASATPGPGGAASPAPAAATSAPTAPAAGSAPPAAGASKTGGAGAVSGVLFTGSDPGGHFCSATVVHSPGRSLIVTAGHCLATGGGLVPDQSVRFAPGYADGKTPYGTWKIEQVWQDERWSDGADDDYDLSFARVAPDPQGRRLEDVTGAAVLDTSGRTGEKVTVTGYPTGRTAPRTCTAVSVKVSDTIQQFDCADFPTGTSGGGWIAAKDGRLVGVLTGGDTDAQSTSTVLGMYALALYQRAADAAGTAG